MRFASSSKLPLALFEVGGTALILLPSIFKDALSLARRPETPGQDDLVLLPLAALKLARFSESPLVPRCPGEKVGIWPAWVNLLNCACHDGCWLPINQTGRRQRNEAEPCMLSTALEMCRRAEREAAHELLHAKRELAKRTFHDLSIPASLAVVYCGQNDRPRGELPGRGAAVLGQREWRRDDSVDVALSASDRAAWDSPNSIPQFPKADQTQVALRASEARYRCLVENLEQSIFLKDEAFRFVTVNKPFCQDLGLTEADILGKTDYDLYPPHLADKYRADDEQVLREGCRLEIEEQNLAAGQTRTVRVVKTPVRDDQGRIVGVLGIFWDVTRERALEEQLRQAQKLDAVGRLAGGIAHDFNNLLTAVLGNIDLTLAQMPGQESSRELLAAANQAAVRAAELTNQLLSFSRQSPLCPRPLSLNGCVDEAVRMLSRTLDPRITVNVSGRPDLWSVEADAGRMVQVLMNLCLNARDAMSEGGMLALTTENVVLDEAFAAMHLDSRPGEFVRLQIRDTGQGMAPEVRARIFEPFFTTKGLGKGTGLGLSVVLGIVQQHQGWIECMSEVGRGTRFDLYLPRADRLEENVAAPVPAGAPRGRGETILLVDDEPLLRDLGSMILETYGYRVLVAADGLEAIELFMRERSRISLVVLDLSMPRLSGRDAYRRLLRIDPHVRVLFTSGYSGSSARHAEVTPRAEGFIDKPYRPEDLALQVRTALDRPRQAGTAEEHAS